ncbi:MAG: hypothetical protein IT477_10835 [Rhodanobacteraceae bacterium]|nr:hypothetical protein [Rhodanobacteraceae bacterium]
MSLAALAEFVMSRATPLIAEDHGFVWDQSIIRPTDYATFKTVDYHTYWKVTRDRPVLTTEFLPQTVTSATERMAHGQ